MNIEYSFERTRKKRERERNGNERGGEGRSGSNYTEKIQAVKPDRCQTSGYDNENVTAALPSFLIYPGRIVAETRGTSSSRVKIPTCQIFHVPIFTFKLEDFLTQ